MKKISIIAALLFTVGFQAFSQCHSKRVASAERHKDIVDIAASDHNFSTLVAAVKAADLVTALKGDGPITVFAPDNSAFDRLPEGTVSSLLQPSQKSTLSKILTYHVVAGNYDARSITNAIQNNGGTVSLNTLSGGKLKATVINGNVFLIDEKGNKSKVTNTDINASNGVIHVIDMVVMPK